MPLTPTDTIALADTLPAPDPAQAVIIMERPAAPAPRGIQMHSDSSATSWIILGLVTLFVLIAIRFRGNLRYTGSLLRELTDPPSEGKIFTDTMRESTFIGLLNLLCIVSAGVLLWQCLANWAIPELASAGRMLPAIGMCLLCTGVLYFFQRIAYFFIGRIFRDRRTASRWLRAYSSSQGLLSLVLLPLALLSLFYPAALTPLLIPSLIAWILARLLFISKGYRIFSPRGSQNLGFLYYLCSVEIVPLILTWSAAISLCHS